jgi:UDP:flavonoid glycosyltransferase YjiC (YdhE family)
VEAAGFRAAPAGGDGDHPERVKIMAQLQRIESSELRFLFFTINTMFDVNARLMTPDVVSIASHWRADLLIREQWELGAAIAAEHLGLPHAAVLVSLQPSGPRVRSAMAERLDPIRAAWGLPPDPELAMLFRYMCLSFDPPSLQNLLWRARPETLHTYRYQPFDRSGNERLPDWISDGLDRPVVYATLGTSVSAEPGSLETIISALSSRPGTLIVSTGRQRDPKEFGSLPSNVHIESYVPEAELLPFCDIVVTHGGHQTVLGCLAAGIPMVIVPHQHEQLGNGRRVQALGAALTVEHSRDDGALGAAVEQVLQAGTFRERAREIQAEILAQPTLEHATRPLEQLAREGTPLVTQTL